MGAILLAAGLVIAAAGVALIFSDKIPFLGRLPGDMVIKRGNVRLYLPITTSIMLSLLFMLALWLVEILRKR